VCAGFICTTAPTESSGTALRSGRLALDGRSFSPLHLPGRGGGPARLQLPGALAAGLRHPRNDDDSAVQGVARTTRCWIERGRLTPTGRPTGALGNGGNHSEALPVRHSAAGRSGRHLSGSSGSKPAARRTAAALPAPAPPHPARRRACPPDRPCPPPRPRQGRRASAARSAPAWEARATRTARRSTATFPSTSTSRTAAASDGAGLCVFASSATRGSGMTSPSSRASSSGCSPARAAAIPPRWTKWSRRIARARGSPGRPTSRWKAATSTSSRPPAAAAECRA